MTRAESGSVSPAGDRPVRVLHVTAPGEFGGLERVVEMLAAGQAERGYDVRALCVLDRGRPPSPLVDRLRSSGVAVDAVAIPPRAYLQERAAISKARQSMGQGVVHTHGYRADVIAATLPIRRSTPRVATVHGFTGGGVKNRLYEQLQKWSYRRAHTVVAVSKSLAELLCARGVPQARLAVIQNAWSDSGVRASSREVRDSLGIDEAAFVAGWVGRVSREKGADVLVDACQELSGFPLTVCVVGEGREEKRLRLQTQQEPVNAVRWIWHGRVDDAARLFPAFDVFVLSSRTEGTPIVLFEAMAGGVPVVAARVGGVPDVVSEREAWLIPPEDPSALASAIRYVHDHPDEARLRAKTAQRRLQDEFGVARWLERYEALYLHVLEVKRRKGRI